MKEIGRRQFISGVVGTAAVAGSMSIPNGSFGAGKDKVKEQYRTFNKMQAETFAAWCNLIVNGSANAGVAYFVDKYISNPYAQSLIMARFFEDSPLSDFYIAGIAGIDKESREQFDRTFVLLESDKQLQIINAASQSKTRIWVKPSPFIFYLMSRSDAIDVVYGTEQGFQNLDIPYLAHLPPPQPW